jgi:hypothetical protein
VTGAVLALAACRPPEPPPPDDGVHHSAVSTVPAPHSAPDPRHSAGAECTHTGLPQPTPEPAFADCPRFDWLVVIGGGPDQHVRHVLPLPDGDVIVAGAYSGQPELSTDCVEVHSGLGPLNGFVARLHPDGTHVWSHSLSGGQSGVLGGVHLAPDGRGVWVAGHYSGGPLRVDGVEVGGLDTETGRGFAVRFELHGALDRALWLGDESAGNYVVDVSEGPEGIVTLLGESHDDVLVVGPLSVPKVSTGTTPDLYVASFDADDRPRWLTVVGMVDIPYGANLQPIQLVPTDTGTLVAAKPFPTAEALTVRTHRGDTSVLNYGDLTMLTTLLSLDRQGRVRDPAWSVSRSTIRDLTPAGPGRTRVVGDVNTPNQWTDPDGVVHPFDNPDFPGAPLAFVAEVDPTGRILTYETKSRIQSLTAANLQPDGTVWWGGALSSVLRTFGEGTERSWLAPTGYGGVAAQYDADGAFRCGFAFSGDRGWVSDVQQDALGGLVVVGEFSSDLTVVSPDGTVAFRDTEDSSLTDGFIARFAPATPP